MQLDPQSYIGTVCIDPDFINADHSYVIQCPKASVPLRVEWVGDKILLWLHAPANENSYGSKLRLWIVPGSRRLDLAVNAGVYLGAVFVPQGNEEANGYVDWHFFHDRLGVVDMAAPAQSSYSLH